MTRVRKYPTPPRGGLLSSSAVRVIGLWILAGALFKFLWGSPNDLPPVVQDFPFPADLGIKYPVLIGIEFAIVAFALLRPKWGWGLVALQLLVFIAVLILTLGQPSCGCFGSKITMPPWLMLTIDGVLLVALLATRPWRTIRDRGMPLVVMVIVCAIGIAAPWFHDRELKGTITIDNQDTDGSRKYVIFALEDWVGKEIGNTEFAKVHEDPYSLPPDGLWVFWRSTCDHCADHLEQLKHEDDGSRMITLIRLMEPHDTLGNRVVHQMPEGSHVIHVQLPDSVDYVITTPGILEMQAYLVMAGEEAAGLTEEERAEAEAEQRAASGK